MTLQERSKLTQKIMPLRKQIEFEEAEQKIMRLKRRQKLLEEELKIDQEQEEIQLKAELALLKGHDGRKVEGRRQSVDKHEDPQSVILPSIEKH